MQYTSNFCDIYNTFGWNYYPEAFFEQLMLWRDQADTDIHSCMDLGCGTGVLCDLLSQHGIWAEGIDLSESMIAIARNRNPDVPFYAADIITFKPEKTFDLVTATHDVFNHIYDIENVRMIFENVHCYLKAGGYFIFDLLNNNEKIEEEPCDMPIDEHSLLQLQTTCDGEFISLKTGLYEYGEQQWEETITEKIHSPEEICQHLKSAGFTDVKLTDHLLSSSKNHGTALFVIAKNS